MKNQLRAAHNLRGKLEDDAGLRDNFAKIDSIVLFDLERDAALALASEKAIELMGLIPLHYEVSTWATRKGISYTGRADQYTLAQDAKLAGK